MNQVWDTGDVARAYGVRAGEYASHLGTMDAVARPDRDLVLLWARTLTGPVLDVGCGPGHWTAYLSDHGIDAAGIDPAPEFVTHARRTYPGVRFCEGRAERLPAPDASVGGLLAWYSLIHLDPPGVATAVTDFRRVLHPGGRLLLGFFEGPSIEPFDHAVVRAFRWPVDALSSIVQDCGFDIDETHTRTDAGRRPHGAIVATAAAR